MQIVCFQSVVMAMSYSALLDCFGKLQADPKEKKKVHVKNFIACKVTKSHSAEVRHGVLSNAIVGPHRESGCRIVAAPERASNRIARGRACERQETTGCIQADRQHGASRAAGSVPDERAEQCAWQQGAEVRRFGCGVVGYRTLFFCCEVK